MENNLGFVGSIGPGYGAAQAVNKPPTHAERIHQLNCARHNHQERISQLEALIASMASELGIALPSPPEKISPSPSW